MINRRKYVLVSSTCSEEEYDRTHIKDCYKTAQSAGKFFRLFCSGFVDNGERIEAYTVRPTGKMESGKDYLEQKDEVVDGVVYHYARSVHRKYINRIVFMYDAFLWFLNKKNVSNNDIVIIDPLRISACIGAVIACKIRGIKLVSYITDVPTCYAFGNNNNISLWSKISYRVAETADLFIFITDQMNEVMNKKNKPYIVVEGFADEKLNSFKVDISQKYKNPTIMYAGGVEKIYGLDILVEGFMEANIPNSELHIYGSGSYVDEIIEKSKTYPQIKYLGCKSNAVIVAEQMKVTLLVNPRYTNADYTKYSFPSKNAEYMASGTTTLTTKLAGMPIDYYPHVYILEEETKEGVAKKIKEILDIDPKKMFLFGQETKKWMMENKCSKKQVQKIIDFIREEMVL